MARAPDYERVFQRGSGWTGADGTYSIPMHGDRTLWLFGDTLIGEVRADGKRELDPRIAVNSFGHRFLHNSLGVHQRGDIDGIEFITGDDGGVPATLWSPPVGGGWFWNGDATVNADGSVTALLNQFQNSEDPRYSSGQQVATWAADIEIDGAGARVSNYRKISSVDAGDEDGRETVWGSSILVESKWTYIYGAQIAAPGVEPQRQMAIARVPTGQIGEDTQWQFFDGAGWSRDSREAKGLPIPLSNESSVQRLANGSYAMIYTPFLGEVSVSFSATPVGPFSPAKRLWLAPECTDTVFTYNAKAHPELSDERGLLVSYNVNSFDLHESLTDPDVYRPRFLRISWAELERLADEAQLETPRQGVVALRAGR